LKKGFITDIFGLFMKLLDKSGFTTAYS